MIDYAPFWETLKNSPENWYTLTSRHHLSHSTLHRLKHNKDISTKTINDLCRILDCPVEGILIGMATSHFNRKGRPYIHQTIKNHSQFIFLHII